MNAIIDAAIGRARTVLAILVLILAAGLVSYLTIPKESAPDIPIPMRDQIGAGPNRGVGMCAPWTSDPKITTIP